MQRELAAEFLGTFSLVSAVCGAALFSAPQAGLMTIAFAVGLSVMAMAFAVGHISGAHFNPAVTCGLVAAGRFPTERAVSYIVAQLLGGAAAAGVFYLVLTGAPPAKWNNFTTISNLYGSGGFSMGAVFLTETVITALFLVVIVGATSQRAPAGFA
ncbi:MAG: aquaporin, partial [Pseudolabrys sp.]